MPVPLHRKNFASPDAARREHGLLRLVRGDGIVPLATRRPDDPTALDTHAGQGSLADVLEERGRLPETECRGIGVDVARAVARVHSHGIGHGDLKPANLVFSPGGELWLADFDAAAALGDVRRRGTPARLGQADEVNERSDIDAIAVLLIECATGLVIDLPSPWTADAFVALGCPPALATDVATILLTATDANRVSSILERRDNRVPRPATTVRGVDPTPTLDFEPGSITGLGPAGDRSGSGLRPDTTQTSSRRRSSRVSRRTTRRASPPATNTTGGRWTLL